MPTPARALTRARRCLHLVLVVVLVVSGALLIGVGLPAAGVRAVAADDEVVAKDTFDRSSGRGWGSAPVGGAWTVASSGAQTSVSSGSARTVQAPSSSLTAELRDVPRTSAEVAVRFSVDKVFAGEGNGFYVGASARKVGGDAYSARVDVGSGGAARLHLLRNFHSIAAPVALTGMRIVPGARYNLSVRAVGTSPTVVSAKVWPASGPEPSAWQMKGSDAYAPLQRSGHPAVFTYVPGSMSNAPVTMSYDSIEVTAPSAGGAAPAPVPPGGAERGPVSFGSVEEMRRSGMFHIPAGADLVVWNHGTKTLEEVFMTLDRNDILVLPERAQPYRVDSTGGFRAAGVSAVTGQGGKRLPIASRYLGKPARTWFAMARAQRGILGMGPGTVIEPTDSGFRQEAQVEDKGSPLPGGGTSGGRFWYDEAGVRHHELVGSQEKIIETTVPDSYFGNFTMRGRDFGGVAYSALASRGGTFERLRLDGAWRGFSGVPNGETAAISVTGGRYLISRTSTSPLDASGRRVGTSPIMINSSPGGRWEYGESSQARAGMPTIWSSSGKHEFFEVTSRWGGPGVNIEQARDGFELVWKGGRIWPNRDNRGGHPSPDGVSGNSLHIALNALGRAKVTLEDVDLDRSVQPGKLCVQLYNVPDTRKIAISATGDGVRIPVAAYGASGVVPLAP